MSTVCFPTVLVMHKRLGTVISSLKQDEMPSHMLWSHNSRITIHVLEKSHKLAKSNAKNGPLIIVILFNKNLIGDNKCNINNPFDDIRPRNIN